MSERTDHFDEYALVQIQQFGGHIVAIEANGWRGTDDRLGVAGSRPGGHFFSVYWSINANYRVIEAQDGRLLADFDPLLFQHPVPPGERYPDWSAEVTLGPGALRAALMAVMEVRTGLVFERGWLGERWPTYRLRY